MKLMLHFAYSKHVGKIVRNKIVEHPKSKMCMPVTVISIRGYSQFLKTVLIFGPDKMLLVSGG